VPYIKDSRRKAILAGDAPKDLGELNFYMTIEIIQRWESLPRYETIHSLFKDFFSLTANNEFIRSFLMTNRSFSPGDVHDAARLAWLEFYRRVGSKYEDLKAQENGDVYRLVSLRGSKNG
jgi:hypothetical protein